MHNLEYRLKSRSRQDRSATLRCARTTDKSFQNGRIYSLISRHNKTKRELTQCIADSHCPASHWFFINEKYMNLYVHRDADMKFVPFVKPVNTIAQA